MAFTSRSTLPAAPQLSSALRQVRTQPRCAHHRRHAIRHPGSLVRSTTLLATSATADSEQATSIASDAAQSTSDLAAVGAHSPAAMEESHAVSNGTVSQFSTPADSVQHSANGDQLLSADQLQAPAEGSSAEPASASQASTSQPSAATGTNGAPGAPSTTPQRQQHRQYPNQQQRGGYQNGSGWRGRPQQSRSPGRPQQQGARGNWQARPNGSRDGAARVPVPDPRHPSTGPNLNLEKDFERADPASIFFKHGDVVLGEVIWANSRGAKVAFLQDRRFVAYMPVQEGPFIIRQAGAPDGFAHHSKSCLPIGFTREFEIIKMPEEVCYRGRGPLVSALWMDLNLLWTRAEQYHQACIQDRENFKITVTEANEGGLMTRVEGLKLFLPVGQMLKPDIGRFYTPEELITEFVGKEVEVSSIEANRMQKRWVVSMRAAADNNCMKDITVGSLLWGRVRRVEDFGCFCGIDGTRISGLLHISNISRTRFEYIQDVFEVGDRVRFVVLGMDPDYTRISLSTAELEENDGDMLRDKEAVFTNAEAQHKLFLEHMQRMLQEQGWGAEEEGHFMDAAPHGQVMADSTEYH